MRDVNTVFNGILACVAIIGAVGSFVSWINSRVERKSAEKSTAIFVETAKVLGIYYQLMIETMQEDKGVDKRAERDKMERAILEFIMLNGDRKTSVAEVASKFSKTTEETIELLTYMLKISHTIGHNGNSLSDSNAQLRIAPNGKTKLEN